MKPKTYISVIDGKIHAIEPRTNGRIKKKIYPWETLNVGDTLALKYSVQIVKNISRYAKQTGKFFKTKRYGDDLKVWRVE